MQDYLCFLIYKYVPRNLQMFLIHWSILQSSNEIVLLNNPFKKGFLNKLWKEFKRSHFLPHPSSHSWIPYLFVVVVVLLIFIYHKIKFRGCYHVSHYVPGVKLYLFLFYPKNTSWIPFLYEVGYHTILTHDDNDDCRFNNDTYSWIYSS